MNMVAELPVVFLAFANDQDRHLATLKEESRAIFQALQPLEQINALAIHREESAEFDELYADLLSYRDRIVIFHYAGHADGSTLQLEGGTGGAGGIAGLLGQQSSLKLVFLNGCATKNQVKLLHDAGVPAVIATAVKISDSKATKLSTAFYAALAEGHSIYEAFESARNYIEGKFATDNEVSISVNRHPNFDFSDQDEPASVEFAWTLYTRADAIDDLEQWRLPSAREAWQIQLHDSQGPIKDPDGEPIHTQYRQRLRSIKAISCQQCSLVSSYNETAPEFCPLCGGTDLQRLDVNTAIPDCQIPFSISEQEARTKAAGALGLTDEQSIQLIKIQVPFWQFDIDTQTGVTGQQGQIKDVHAQDLELEWQDINEQINLTVSDYLVPAFRQSQPTTIQTDDWYWELDKAQAMSQLELSTTLVPLEVSVQEAFVTLGNGLRQEIEAEAVATIGGQQQKNISTEIRYTQIRLRSILLPHWCACVAQAEQKTSLLINGQSGALKIPQTSGIPSLNQQGNLSMNNSNGPSASSEKSSMWVSIYSGAGIGVMVGLLMGLAAPQGADAKSIVAVFIGAVGVGLAALLGLNDQHFSMAKGLRIGSFGLAVAISGLAGIYVRDNSLLSPNITQRATELKAIFPQMSEDKLLSLLSSSGTTTTDADGKVTKTSGQLRDVRSAMFSVDRSPSTCSLLSRINEDRLSADGALKIFRYRDEQGTLGWKNLADQVEKKLSVESDQKAFLFIARDAVCGRVPNAQQVKPESAQCQNLLAQAGASSNLKSAFGKDTHLNQILTLVDERISKQNQDLALEMLVPVLCSAKITQE
ncbi:CHAT domain-containing protein [Aliiglaciecola litoralis]|uniref:CHAT domain-containing protein n=1 Tax=Aliiglaciecola litoralis TaxID=582857 RepID=A0ABP3X784_9ALTE